MEERTHDEDALGRDRILGEFNQSMLDPVGPVGPPERQMKVLGEMNELAEHHE